MTVEAFKDALLAPGEKGRDPELEKAVDAKILASLRGCFPVGTQLTVVAVNDEGQILVRWKLDAHPGMTNEALLQVLV